METCAHHGPLHPGYIQSFYPVHDASRSLKLEITSHILGTFLFLKSGVSRFTRRVIDSFFCGCRVLISDSRKLPCRAESTSCFHPLAHYYILRFLTKQLTTYHTISHYQITCFICYEKNYSTSESSKNKFTLSYHTIGHHIVTFYQCELCKNGHDE